VTSRAQQSGGVELPDDPFEIAQAAGKGMDWHNIAIAGRGQRHEAEIDQMLARRFDSSATDRPRKCVLREQIDECEEGHKRQADRQIKQDGAVGRDGR